MMLARELRLPDTLRYNPSPTKDESTSEYAVGIEARLKQAHRYNRIDRPISRGKTMMNLKYREGVLVLFEDRQRRKGDSSKLGRPFCGPYTVLKEFPNHTYKIEILEQASIQNEARLNLRTSAEGVEGKVPVTREAYRQPYIKRAVNRRTLETTPLPSESTVEVQRKQKEKSKRKSKLI